MSYTQEQVTEKIGTHLLFLAQSTATWSLAQFAEAAQWAKAHGIDTLLVKVCDGGNLWYGGIQGYSAIEKALHSEGVGCIPYGYMYGNLYGAIESELRIIHDYIDESGVFCADIEVEWDNRTDFATTYASQLQNRSGLFLVSTWADPSLQSFNEVCRILSPVVDAWMPQQYNTWLGYDSWNEYIGLGLDTRTQPTLNLDQSFGVNDAVSLARLARARGATSISMWSYDLAVNASSLVDAIVAAFPKLTTSTPTQPTQGDDGMIPVLDSTKRLTPGTGEYEQAQIEWGDPATWGNGINQIWECMYANGYNPGTPTGPEKENVNWGKGPIKMRKCDMGVRFEYDMTTNTCRVFTLTQEVTFK